MSHQRIEWIGPERDTPFGLGAPGRVLTVPAAEAESYIRQKLARPHVPEPEAPSGPGETSQEQAPRKHRKNEGGES